MKKEILNSKEVAQMLGISRATLWRLRASSNSHNIKPFPKPIQLSLRLIGWERSVIEDWIQEQRKQLH